MSHAYTSKNECPLQKAVYQIIPEHSFIGALYVNSNIPEKCDRMMLSKKKIAKSPEDSTDIYKRNMMNRYILRRRMHYFNNSVMYYSINDISCK